MATRRSKKRAKKKGTPVQDFLDWRAGRRARKAARLTRKLKRKKMNKNSTGVIRKVLGELNAMRREGRDERHQRATTRWHDRPSVFRPEPAPVKLTPVSIFRGEVVGGGQGAGLCGYMDTSDGRPCQNLVDEDTPACSAGHPNAQHRRRPKRVAR